MKIGLIVPHLTGHCNPGSSLGRIVQDLHEDNEVILISLVPGKAFADKFGLGFCRLGTEEEAADAVKDFSKLATLEGNEGVAKTFEIGAQMSKVTFRDLPRILTGLKVDALIIDEVCVDCFSVAEYLKIPHGVICNALPLIPDPWCPLFLTTWQPHNHPWWATIRNQIACFLFEFMLSYLRRANSQWRREHGLPRVTGEVERRRGLFFISQLPAVLDFPRQRMSNHFFHARPFHTAHRDDDRRGDFPWDLLDPSRPMVYASMGTLQNAVEHTFCNLAQACNLLDSTDTPIQLVLALGSRKSQESKFSMDRLQAVVDAANRRSQSDKNEKHFPKIILVDYAPQVAVLPKASLLITHAGQNTALEGIMAGLPIIAIPITNDQPGVAARLVYAGAAQLLTTKATSAQLKDAIRAGLSYKRYREASERLQDQIKDDTQTPSLEQVAKLIQAAFERNVGKTGNYQRLCHEDDEVAKIMGPALAKRYISMSQASEKSGTEAAWYLLPAVAVGVIASWAMMRN